VLVLVIPALITWACFVGACAAHAVYHVKAARRLPPRTGAKWQAPAPVFQADPHDWTPTNHR
jgi:hypothetical protein